jgi:uncharacterized membrane protein
LTCAFGLALAVVVFLFASVMLSYWFDAREQTSDAGNYQGYAAAMRDGAVPYRDFAFEYPPGALPVFLAPTLAAGPHDADGYGRWFARLMGAFGVCCVVLVGFTRSSAPVLGFLAVSPLLVGPIFLGRFDLWPAALVAGSVAALLRDRHKLGWAALGAAFAAKVYPIVLVPIAVVWTLRRRGPSELTKGIASGALVVAAAFVPFGILAPHGLWESLWAQASRPFQIESLVASFLMTFSHPRVIGGHGSLNVAGHDLLATLLLVAELATLAALWVAFARGEAEEARFVRYVTGCVCAFVVFGKVLSPQYLIWLLPLVPLVRGRRGLAATAVLAAALVATQIWLPSHRYLGYASSPHHLAWLVLSRNLLLLTLLAVIVAPGSRRYAGLIAREGRGLGPVLRRLRSPG